MKKLPVQTDPEWKFVYLLKAEQQTLYLSKYQFVVTPLMINVEL